MKHLIVLVGLPGSGKSTLCKKEQYADYLRISQDDQGKEGCKRLFQVGLLEGKNIIVDRCNFNCEQRNRYLIPAKKAGYKTTIIWLKVGREQCIERINERTDHPNLAKGNEKIESVVRMFNAMFVAPNADEADELIEL